MPARKLTAARARQTKQTARAAAYDRSATHPKPKRAATNATTRNSTPRRAMILPPRTEGTVQGHSERQLSDADKMWKHRACQRPPAALAGHSGKRGPLPARGVAAALVTQSPSQYHA